VEKNQQQYLLPVTIVTEGMMVWQKWRAYKASVLYTYIIYYMKILNVYDDGCSTDFIFKREKRKKIMKSSTFLFFSYFKTWSTAECICMFWYIILRIYYIYIYTENSGWGGAKSRINFRKLQSHVLRSHFSAYNALSNQKSRYILGLDLFNVHGPLHF